MWILTADNEIVESGELTADILPQRSKQVTIPFKNPEKIEGTGYRLLLSFRQKERTLWADPGFEIAWDQFDLPWSGNQQIDEIRSVKHLTVKDENGILEIAGDNFKYVFEKSSGILSSIQIKGKEIITKRCRIECLEGPLANEVDDWAVWRTRYPYRSQGYGGWASSEWYAFGLDNLQLIPEYFSYKMIGDESVEIQVKNLSMLASGNGAFMNHFIFRISGTGEMTIDHSVIPNGIMPSWLTAVRNGMDPESMPCECSMVWPRTPGKLS